MIARVEGADAELYRERKKERERERERGGLTAPVRNYAALRYAFLYVVFLWAALTESFQSLRA
jgi:hypothetical protein